MSWARLNPRSNWYGCSALLFVPNFSQLSGPSAFSDLNAFRQGAVHDGTAFLDHCDHAIHPVAGDGDSGAQRPQIVDCVMQVLVDLAEKTVG